MSFPQTQSLCTLFTSKPDINEAKRRKKKSGNDEPQVKASPSQIFSLASGALKCQHASQDILLCALNESDVKLFLVSRLSSLTETKWLSFFLTPPNSFKCHRNTLSWCRAEQHWQNRVGVSSFRYVSLSFLCIRTRSHVYFCLFSEFAGGPGGEGGDRMTASVVASQPASNSEKSRNHFWHEWVFSSVSPSCLSRSRFYKKVIFERAPMFLHAPSWDNQQLVQSRVISRRWLKTINMIKHGGGYF